MVTGRPPSSGETMQEHPGATMGQWGLWPSQRVRPPDGSVTGQTLALGGAAGRGSGWRRRLPWGPDLALAPLSAPRSLAVIAEQFLWWGTKPPLPPLRPKPGAGQPGLDL